MEPLAKNPWHSLFGLALTEVLGRVGCRVELEVDLSRHRQLLDVFVIRRQEPIAPDRLPDGLREMPRYTLMTFKSLHQALVDWSLKELTGHYVNLRKQTPGAKGAMLPESEFLLLAVCSRRPTKLMRQVKLERTDPGVYLTRRGTDAIRIVVLNEIGERTENAVWDLFSADPVQCQRGALKFIQSDPNLSTLLTELWKTYRMEGIEMPLTLEDLKRKQLAEMTTEERIRGLSTKEVVRALPTDELLGALPADQLLRAIPVELLEAEIRKRKKAEKKASRKP